MKERALLLISLVLAGCAAMTPDQARHEAEQTCFQAGVTIIDGRACVAARLAQTPARQPTFLESLGAGMQGAGAIMSDDVYNAQRGLPPPAPMQFRNTDLQCMNTCTRSYSYGLCQQRCTY